MLAVSSFIGHCNRTAKQHRRVALASVAKRWRISAEESWGRVRTRDDDSVNGAATELETQRRGKERKEQDRRRGQHAREARFQTQRTETMLGAETPGSVRKASHGIRAKITVRCAGNAKTTSLRSLWKQSAGSSLKNGLESVQMGGSRTKRETMGSLVYFSS